MVSSIVEWFGALGASLLLFALECSVFAGAALVGFLVSEKRRSQWQGWVAGLLMLVVLFVIFMPSIASLNETSCKGARDFQACLDGPDE